MEQKIITSDNNYKELGEWIKSNASKKVFLVCGRSISRQEKFVAYLRELETAGTGIIMFSDFSPNPLYESVVKGVDLFKREGCDSIIGAGGGSAMDVAKCIKLYSNMDDTQNFLEQTIVPNDIPFLAMPTTAGTGSEATRYAVIYYEGRKQSVTSDSIIPGTVLFDPSCLESVPAYHKKATMMDAFCHAMESFWSVNSTRESRSYARSAIEGIMEHMEGYLANTREGNAGMLLAANNAGKAINISQTTAGHAMCYKITSLFGCAHGHSAILCDRVLYPHMIGNIDKCIDPRGKDYLRNILDEIAFAMGCSSAEEGAAKLNELFESLGLSVPSATQEQFTEMKTSVNPVRLKNHPVALDTGEIDSLYHRILLEATHGC